VELVLRNSHVPAPLLPLHSIALVLHVSREPLLLLFPSFLFLQEKNGPMEIAHNSTPSLENSHRNAQKIKETKPTHLFPSLYHGTT
jgi:hypothetical protein